jgi:IPT/TIG domain-containing protein
MNLHGRRYACVVIAAFSLWAISCIPSAQAGAVPPTVESFDPMAGPEGTVVTITGIGFTGATAVTFNGTNASFTVESDAQITATVPAGATTGPIAVTTPGGTDASATNFTVTTPPTPAPTVSSFAPTSGDLFTQVTIQGSDFTGATLVTIRGCDVPFTVDSDTQITATVGEGANTGRIRVTTPAGTGTSTQPFTLTRRDHRSTVSLRLREHLLARGKVRVPDGYNGCKFRRLVRVQRKTSHGWDSVGKDRSARSGRYKTQLPDKPGRYRAVVTKEAMHYDLCEDATSGARRHRHASSGGGGGPRR